MFRFNSFSIQEVLIAQSFQHSIKTEKHKVKLSRGREITVNYSFLFRRGIKKLIIISINEKIHDN